MKQYSIILFTIMLGGTVKYFILEKTEFEKKHTKKLHNDLRKKQYLSKSFVTRNTELPMQVLLLSM